MEEQKSGNSSNKKPGKHPILIITTICVVIAAAACGWLSYIQINRYEKGILEVCATQQDSYVQLVLDQINLKENIALPVSMPPFNSSIRWIVRAS